MTRFAQAMVSVIVLTISWHVHGPLAVPKLAADSGGQLGSPFIAAGNYVYVSGQGPRRSDGTTPTQFTEQVRQALANVKGVLGSAGLSMDHVVYTQVYLQDTSRYPELDRVFAESFPESPPARAVLGVARVPEPTIQISAVAVRDLKGREPVSLPDSAPSKGYSPGTLTEDLLFVSTMPGDDSRNSAVRNDAASQVNLALDRLNSVVESAHLTMAHMVFVNPYLTAQVPTRVMNEQYAKRFQFGNTPARATIQVSSLPEGAQVAFTGIAVRDLSRRHAVRPKNMPPSPTASPCVFAGEILYCSAKDGFIPGPNGGIYAASTADQTRQTMRNLLDNLEEASLNFDQVVYTTIYLDDLSDSPSFAKIYKKYFSGAFPAQTSVQQLPPGERKPDAEGHYPALEQVSLVAVRGH